MLIFCSYLLLIFLWVCCLNVFYDDFETKIQNFYMVLIPRFSFVISSIAFLFVIGQVLLFAIITILGSLFYYHSKNIFIFSRIMLNILLKSSNTVKTLQVKSLPSLSHCWEAAAFSQGCWDAHFQRASLTPIYVDGAPWTCATQGSCLQLI